MYRGYIKILIELKWKLKGIEYFDFKLYSIFIMLEMFYNSVYCNNEKNNEIKFLRIINILIILIIESLSWYEVFFILDVFEI